MKNLLFWNERPSRRIRLMENELKKDPFLYHKKKNVISSRFNDSNEKDGQNTNRELLFCQDENNKQINFYKNYINSKSSTIEANTDNYLKYMMKERQLSHKIMPTEASLPFDNIYDNSGVNKKYVKKFAYQESYTPNKYAYQNNNNNLTISNYRVDSMGVKNNNKNNSQFNYKNYGENNINDIKCLSPKKINDSFKHLNQEISYEDDSNIYNNIKSLNNNDDNIRNSNFLPKIQSLKGTTDITNHNYYDKISKQLILQMNKNYQNYNKDLVSKRYSPNIGNKMYLRNDNIALPPGSISNPRYYNLGESRLSSNPIVNPGNRAPIFNNLNNHNHRLKSEFI